MGINVVQNTPIDVEGLLVSSSLVRRLLAEGDVSTAATFLGRRFEIEGTVEHGFAEGRKIDFPTANLRPDCEEQLVPGRGVYAVKAEVDGFSYMAMVNIGWRPTLDNGADQTIEAHLLDYEGGDMYGKHLRLHFLRRVRDEHRFGSIEELQAQLALDADCVRAIFAER